jgi:hypothetical protein
MLKVLKYSLLAGVVGAVAFGSSAIAAAVVVVTPSNTQGWSTADTRPGGAVNFVSDPTSPFPDGALQLTTDGTTAAKAQYLHSASTSLSSVTDLSYYTKNVGGPDIAAPSYQLIVLLNGTSSGFTTLVYEPYQNGTVATGTWQQWDVDQGQFWSSRSFTEGTCSVTAGAGGAPFYTLAGLQATCPDAVVVGFGVNIGTFNPGYNVYTDGVTFNDTTYNFELDPVVPPGPTDKDQCKNGGWATFTNPTFKNQGDCVSYVNHL